MRINMQSRSFVKPYRLVEGTSFKSTQLGLCRFPIPSHLITWYWISLGPDLRHSPRHRAGSVYPPNLNSKALRPTPVIIFMHSSSYFLPVLLSLSPPPLTAFLNLSVLLSAYPTFPFSFMSSPRPTLSLSLSPFQGQSSSQPLSQPTHP